MCGVNLIIKPEGDGKEAIKQMMLSTAHRGPDFSGSCQISDQVWMAGNRLKILDLSEASNQPMWSEDKKAVLVWNGALYNYQDLRNQLLDLGYTFKTNSDSEVFLLWLKHFGENKISELHGMFAFTFVDLEKKEVIVGRDPSGEKPLYFYQNDQSWLFSSKARGINSALISKPTINQNQFLPYFYSRHSFPNQSFFLGVHQVLPGKGYVIDFEGNVLKNLSWTHQKLANITPNQAEFESRLKDAVLKNFHTERPIGVILSGGADSSLLYQLWLEETGQPMPTFTVAFDKKYQEKYADPIYANKLTNRYEGYHHEVLVTPEKITKNWQEYINTLDQPIGDSASILTWLVAKEAKEEVQVLISGAGADELFAGYNRHLAFLKYLQRPKFYENLKGIASGFPLPASLKKFFSGIDQDPRKTFLNFSSLQNIPEEEFSKFLAWYPNEESNFQNALHFDRTYYLINDVLKIHDNACMAHGIEGRAPYLDFELIQWTKSFSEASSIAFAGKKLIKTALKERGLKMIANRKKIGFGLPLKEWFSENLTFRNWVYSEIKNMHDTWGKYFPQAMQPLTKEPQKAPKDQFLLIWNMFILASWLKNKQ
ncbi:asparagine synthase, glutamine-hydrolyzing [Belliella baltica DSM 15883]|uniref:asparagine synthase (glutamine-hydrolyzing) n=1 Tax=Belliella baltica (strain DSM 15883 / CIP 108006 / LMG 21964 / BA134) TaxID=866536 RepID=I3Z2R9_BELBD|nr:asparagine synthase (glutamine-hydrolyzing) [Belliella baltica]AFL83537.1 asparagine synthase, glutamine-hydrolyzing [Belliella baltica DSM 15883]